jgi:hypothetical protein
MTVPPSSNSSSNSSSNTTNPPPPRSVPRRQFSRAEVEVLNLVNHPIWVFDVLNKCMWWGNSAACNFWNAKTLDDLTGRNFANDMSETVQKKNMDILDRLRRNEKWEEVVRTFVIVIVV